MVAQALPLAKIGTLFIKTLAKPVSKRIKKDFSRFEQTRRMLVGIGQLSNQVTSRMAIWSEGYTVRKINPLSDDKALTTGADLVGETFVLSVSVGTVIWEYNRSAEKARLKEEKLRATAKAERDALQANFLALDERLKALEEVVQYNSQSILNVGGKRLPQPRNTVLIRISDEDDDNLPMVPTTKKPKPDAHNETQTTSQSDPNADSGVTDTTTETEAPWWKFW
ncbi:atrophy 3 protein homolog [Seminavis robusta]|uniref:Atrophy 3 protein homolog n=1 Tax=Seminavis robusta TaxID=568900 RepID=A0A9N8H3M2_9STRA|nr:atrophy 3 protein homolog [Seminavis robusta]|eukprot:Sro91_g047540.1 atrophy 3 protein homolog (224) ;mRNA; f:6699-7498